jgi:hypothetical protein
MSLYYLKFTQKENIMKIVKIIANEFWSFFCAIGQAKYAAELARNQKWAQAQALYKK